MEKIFYTERSAHLNTDGAVRQMLSLFFGVSDAEIVRNENGKPFLRKGANPPLFFSVSHTADLLFIAVSDENVGIDAELLSRKTEYLSVAKKFSPDERQEISSSEDFLRHWTAKESAVKWLGGTLARDLYQLRFVHGNVFYKAAELPVRLAFPAFEGYALAVCCERDFSEVKAVRF